MAWFECTTGASSGNGVALIVTTDASFAGSNITASNGEDTFTQQCPSSAPYVVTFEDIPTGTYTISGIAMGQTITKQFTVLDYETTLYPTPDGATVLPINDIQTWLHCADIWDKSYTTIEEVLADNTTLLALISNNNAVDYMVRSTTWAGGNKLVPKMTSNTSPKGEAFGSALASGDYNYFHVFDDVKNTKCWLGSSSPSYLGYDATEEVKILKAYVILEGMSYSSIVSSSIKVQASNDKSNWVDISTTKNTGNVLVNDVTKITFDVAPTRAYRYHRFLFTVTGGSYNPVLYEANFYIDSSSLTDNQTAMTYIGANDYCAKALIADSTWLNAIANSNYIDLVLNVKVPTMASDTTPSGTVISSSAYQPAYYAFDNNDSSAFLSNSVGNLAGSYIGYIFTNPKQIFIVMGNVNPRGTDVQSTLSMTIKIQGSNNGTDWVDIVDTFTPSFYFIEEVIGNSEHYTYYRVYCVSGSATNGRLRANYIQFYGRE